MNNKDRIALTAALALVAGIIGFIVVKGDDGVTAAYYYLSIAPDVDVNAVARNIAPLSLPGAGRRCNEPCAALRRAHRRCDVTACARKWR